MEPDMKGSAGAPMSREVLVLACQARLPQRGTERADRMEPNLGVAYRVDLDVAAGAGTSPELSRGTGMSCSVQMHLPSRR